jgi:hypothetical protein
MQSDISRLERQLAEANFKNLELAREVDEIKSLLRGKIRQNISVPSGLEGIRLVYEVLAEQMGAEEADEGAVESPLTVIPGSAANKVQIVPGYINGSMVKLGGANLNRTPPPELTISGTTTIYLKVVTTYAASPRDVATVQTTTGTAQLTPDGFTSYRRIAEVKLQNRSAVITNFSAGGSYSAAAFGATIIWWKD